MELKSTIDIKSTSKLELLSTYTFRDHTFTKEDAVDFLYRMLNVYNKAK